MKKLFTLILLLVTTVVYGGNIAIEVNKKQLTQLFYPINAFKSNGSNINIEILKDVSNYTELGIDASAIGYIVNDKPTNIKLFIPGINKSVLLYKDNSTDDLKVITSSGKRFEKNNIVSYRGVIEGDDNSVVSITFTYNDIVGMIANNNGNYVIGKVEGTQKYIIYNDRDLLIKKRFECGTNESHVIKSKTEPSSQFIVGLKCVNFYYETDYDIFVNKGSVANVTSYVQGLFTQVATLYANDSMNIRLKTLFVWDTVDPYTGTTTSNLLTQFGQYRTTFDGDLAHLLGYVGSGGIAYVNSLCSSANQYKMAYSDINSTYSIVPTYSWTIEVVAHESGHNVASKHTHDCAWNGNNTPIDGCGPAAGYTVSCTAGPIPTGGGTIMSYCHLVSGVGINFNLGFGPQPKTLMKNTIAAKTCLFACDTTGTGGGGGGTGCTSAPAQPGAISGVTTVCSGTTNSFSIQPVTGATSYVWTVPAGWTGSSTGLTLTATANSTSGNITVAAVNACGTGVAQTKAVTALTVPTTPTSISGPTGVCKNQTGVIYSTPLVANATSYTWTVPTGSTITAGQGTNTITVTFGTRKGRVTVKANNGCGSSATRSININITCRELDPSLRDFTITVNPNPANDILNLQIESYITSKYVIIMKDMSGKVVYVREREFGIGANVESIDVNNFTSGIYLLEILSNNTKYDDKIIISK